MPAVFIACAQVGGEQGDVSGGEVIGPSASRDAHRCETGSMEVRPLVCIAIVMGSRRAAY